MPAAMNIQPRKLPSLGGMLRHDFREYEPGELPNHIDEDRTQDNALLYGSRDALDNLPTRQPDTGRKIRRDANVAGSVVMTLPVEIDPQDRERVEAWTEASVEQLQQMPGKLAYAVLHRDETRPHIHGVIVPVDERGHLSWKRDYGRREAFRGFQAAYSARLAELGVEPTPEAEKAVRRAGYTQSIHGWRVGRAVIDAQERVREAEERVVEAERRIQALTPEPHKGPPPKMPPLHKRAQEIERLQREVDRYERVIAARDRDDAVRKRLRKDEERREQERVDQVTRERDHFAKLALDRTPPEQHLQLAQECEKKGLSSEPTDNILSKEWYRQWQEREQDRGLGL